MLLTSHVQTDILQNWWIEKKKKKIDNYDKPNKIQIWQLVRVNIKQFIFENNLFANNKIISNNKKRYFLCEYFCVKLLLLKIKAEQQFVHRIYIGIY